MSQRMSKTMSVVYIAFLLIGSYVLLFSTIPLLYRIAIVAMSFILLLLISLALQTMENIKTKPEWQPAREEAIFSDKLIV